MAIVEYQREQGTMQLSVAEQREIDWSLLVNGRIVDGVLQTRPGWEIMRAPQSYLSVADPSSPDGFAYQPDQYEVAVQDLSTPLGSFLFSGPDGNEYIFSIRNDGAAFNKFDIYTTSGQKVLDQPNIAAGILFPTVNGAVINNISSMLPDPTDQTYCFARWVDTVFFCNGGYLWRWEPLRAMHRPEIVTAFRNPTAETSGNYVKNYIYGATIVAVHLESLVLSGFAQGTVVELDTDIDVQSSGNDITTDPSKTGGTLVEPKSRSVTLNPYYIMVSDQRMVNCFQFSGTYQVQLEYPITALTSHTGRLVLFSHQEMCVITGQIVINSQITQQIISTGIGCIGKRAHCQTSQGLLVFLGDTNVYAWSGAGLPQIVSEQIQTLFREGTQGFWRWNINPAAYDVGQIASLPFRVLTTKSDTASAVWNAANNYVAIAVTSGTQRENNDLVLCWNPTSNQWWIDSVEATTPEMVLSGAVPNQYWTQDPGTPRSAAVGRYTLMVSEADPTLLFAQCYAYDIYTSNTPQMSLCVLHGDTDDALSYLSTSIPDKNRFAFLAISAPIALGDSDHKLQRRLFMRTMGIRPDIPGLPNLTLYVIPEDGHSDVRDSTDTVTVASEQEMSTWRESQLPSPYWQTAPGAISVGMYGGTGALPPGWQQSFIKRWYPLAPVDRRLDIPSRVMQWFRIALSKVVTEENGSPLQVLSTSVEIRPNYGVRKG